MKFKPLQEQEKELTIQDITEKIISFQKKHRNVFVHQIEDQVFIYRSLGRKEYKDLLKDERFDEMAKEELICQVCTLHPNNFDFEDCDAGVPTKLAEAIITNSFLDSVEARKSVLNYYREEMFDLDNQITCIINEAFSQHDIEEIEDWDIERTTKYLSRAEWKLHNLRGMEFVDTDSQESFYEGVNKHNPQDQKEVKTEEVGNEQNIRGGKKEKLTPEKLQELKAKYPEIDWENDTIATEGPGAMKKGTVDTDAPALRPGT